MRVPEIEVDLWSEAVLRDPYPTYARLRALGRVLFDSERNAYVLAGYDEVRLALQDWETFSSADGVAVNDRANKMGGRGILTADPPVHDARRAVLGAPLVSGEIAHHREFLVERANALVDDLVGRGSFDVVTELAQRYSVGVVGDLIGLPEAGREHLIDWATAAFDTLGPDNPRTDAAWPGLAALFGYAASVSDPDRLPPGSWGARIHEAGERGVVDREDRPGLMMALLWAGMDTTANSIGSAVSLFADHPDQWDLLRSDRSLLASATNEILRIEPPVQRFSRATTREVEIGGHTLPSGARVVLLFGSANRDERRFPEPERFDVTRNPTDHLAFGRGIHRCVGAGLAQEEIRAVLDRLADRVTRFEIVDRAWRCNNSLHGLERLVVSVA
ncbi:MAG: cytochrome P450 [Ilumatobacteraceae bacterium]